MLKIGEKIKELRKAQDVTQEKLADYLNISYQAVSKWENGLALPDLSLIPALSNFFGATSDYLLDISLDNKSEIIENVLKEARSYTHTGEITKSIAIIEEALQTYPNEHKLLSDLIEYKVMVYEDNDQWLSDIEQKANLILRDCNIDKIRHSTIVNLAFAYSFCGKREKVLEIANLLPDTAYSKRELLSLSVPAKERASYKSECILAHSESILIDILCISKHHYLWGDPEIAIDVCNRALDIIKALGDEGYPLYFKASAYEDLSMAYAKLQNKEKMFNANQTLPVIDRSNQGSFKTRRRYKAVMNRFCGYLGENTTLQNFRNVEVRHVRSYIEHLQISGCKPGYILTELSGIKWVHQRMNPKRNLPKSNKCFFVAKRQLYIKDKSILPHEFDDLIKVALDMGCMDAVIEAYMDRYFGLRHEEFVTLRVHQIEYALKHKQLNLTNTKGGRPRDIPVETKMQENILRRVLAYAQKNGKSSTDYVICDNHTNSVKKKSKSLDNWMNNNKKKFMDPERTKYKSLGKRPREQSIHWHSLRHLFYQETKERYKAEGRMTDAQIERELSESMGHSRNDVNNTYSNEIKRIH